MIEISGLHKESKPRARGTARRTLGSPKKSRKVNKNLAECTVLQEMVVGTNGHGSANFFLHGDKGNSEDGYGLVE